MSIEIGNGATQFNFWEYLFGIFDTVCELNLTQIGIVLPVLDYNSNNIQSKILILDILYKRNFFRDVLAECTF